jgi:hypothetical protein
MPAPRTISLTLDGTDKLGAPALWARQTNPLTLDCEIDSDLTLLTGAATFAAEIHASAAPNGAAPLAAAEVEAADEATFEFASADMGFTIGTSASVFRYLFITALDATGEETQTLYARRIEIKANGYSGSRGFLTITSATPDGDGMFPVSFRGLTGRIVISDAVSDPGDASGFLRITSATADEDGMYPVTYLDMSGRILISDVEGSGDSGSQFLYITSSADDEDGMYPVTFRGLTGRILISDVA